MKNGKKLNGTKVPTVRINPALEYYQDKILFPEQLARAKELLKNAKLPSRKPSSQS